MTKKFRRGLVVGKFAPLHRGHEWLIARAQEASEELVIVSYSKPELDGCDPVRRERWLEELFPAARRLIVTDERVRAWRTGGDDPNEIPTNEADDVTHRRFVGWLCRRVLRVTVDAVFTSEDYGDGFAAELTRYFRLFDSKAAAVSHLSIDPARGTVPISATKIRSNVHGYRQWLNPVVYASFVERVCFLGGESTGKSTLSAALAREFGTEFVAEYGRELWEAKSGALSFDDLASIAHEQVAREESQARRANRFLFCDTSPLTTLFYSHALFNRAAPEVEQLAARTYDHVFLCAPDFPLVQDGTRQYEGFRQRQHAWYLSELKCRGVRFTLLEGTIAQRIATVKATVPK